MEPRNFGRRALLRRLGAGAAATLSLPGGAAATDGAAVPGDRDPAARSVAAGTRPSSGPEGVHPSAGSTQSAAGWPMAGFDPAGTGYSPFADPPTDGVALAFAAETPAAARPAVVNRTAFLPGTDGALHTLGTESGRGRWVFPVSQGARRPTSPAVAAERVLVGDGDATLYGLDALSGAERWSVDRAGLGDSAPVVHEGVGYVAAADAVFGFDVAGGSLRWVSGDGGGEDASLAVTDDLVVVGGETLDALGADSGRRRWRFDPPDGRVGSPAIAAGAVFVAGEGGRLYAVDARTGGERWRLDPDGPGGPPAVADGVVYAGSGASLDAIDAATGDRYWSFDGDGDGWSAPAVAGGTVLAWNHGDRLYALDRCTGELRWSADRPIELGIPVVAGGTVLVGSAEGTFALVAGDRRAHDPRSYRDFEPAWSFAPGSQLVRGVVADGDSVFVATQAGFGRSARWVHTLDAADGTHRWSRVGGSWIPEPTIAAGTVPLTTGPTSVVGVDAVTGRPRWSIETDGELLLPTAVVGSTVVVPGSSGRVRAVHGATREPRWTADLATASLPVHGDGTLYLRGAVEPVGDDAAQVVALDAATGEVVWASDPSPHLGDVPRLVGDAVYVSGTDGHLTALAAGSGEQRWHRSFGAPVAAATGPEGAFLQAADGTLYGVDPGTGATRWAVETGAGTDAAPTVADGTVLVDAGGGVLSAFDAASGERRWTRSREGADWSAPAVDGGVAYVADGGGRLYALALDDGSVLGWYDGAEQFRQPAVHGEHVYAGLLGLYAIPTATAAGEGRADRAGTDAGIADRTGADAPVDACERAGRRTAAPATARPTDDRAAGRIASDRSTAPPTASVDAVGTPGFGVLAAGAGLAGGLLARLLGRRSPADD